MGTKAFGTRPPPAGDLAHRAKLATVGRVPGIPMHYWMKPDAYVAELGMSFEDPFNGDKDAFDALRPALFTELPLPWEVCRDGDRIYYLNAGLVPPRQTTIHPFKTLHLAIIQGLRNVVRPIGGLFVEDVQECFTQISTHLTDHLRLKDLGSWAPVSPIYDVESGKPI